MERCDICGQPISGKLIVDNSKPQIKIICEQCESQMYTCYLCERVQKGICDFESNSSPIPPVIQKRIQRGPIQTVANIPNPDRIEITCKKGCPCYHEENWCLRQTNLTCGNFTLFK